jgi:hypothetical protein
MPLLPRLHLLELEDQAWFPPTIRDLATDYLHFVETRFGLDRALVPLVTEVLRASGTALVVDLCSGGGGPVPALQRSLAKIGLEVDFILTDQYPNLAAFESAAAAAVRPDSIRFVAAPVDARDVPRELRGCRTLFNALHHFRPTDARAILRDAVADRQPFLALEISDRRVVNVLSILLITPLLAIAGAFLIRPFSWRRVFWSTVVPAVPFVCVWDGVVSQLRAYTVAELEAMSRKGEPGYSWRAGHVATGVGAGRLTYLVGWPV